MTPNEDDELRQAARAEVMEMLGQLESIHATTFANAIVQAENLKETHNIMIAINSLWAWYYLLPVEQQKAIGEFTGRRPQNKLWMSRHSLLRDLERRQA